MQYTDEDYSEVESINDNPYEFGTIEYKQWEIGFLEWEIS